MVVSLNDQQLLRYSRHILLDGFDTSGQEKLLAGHVVIVGLGGLGSPVATYLASAGVGRLTLCDFDVVELSNLQRQMIHRESRLGMNKALSAQEEIRSINPGCRVESLTERVDAAVLGKLVSEADVVVDATDNFETRHAINRVCVDCSKPLVSGTAINYVGQVAVFDMRTSDPACYACFVPIDSPSMSDQCASSGVLAPLTGTIGSIQATEVIKLLVFGYSDLNSRVLLYDAKGSDWCSVQINRRQDCLVCGPS